MKGSFSFSIILGLLLSALASAQIPAGPTGPPAGTVAVLNFANLGQGNDAWDWLGKGLADLTIGDLVGQGLKVVSREQMQELVRELRLKKQQHDPRSVALVLKSQHCVHGTYRVAGGKVELHASILEVASGKQLHAAAVTGGEGEVLKMQKKLAAELADVLQGHKAGTLDPGKLPQWTDSLPASQLLYKGIDEFDRGGYLLAWGLFRRALRQDAKYADAQYWAGRMLYYVQEHHQARIDLERFAVAHPKHPRAGEAAMEIINTAQQSAVAADEVLQVLTLAAKLAPTAEVPNQFGPGNPSTVGLYTAGLAAQILRADRRYREAFERFDQPIQQISVQHPLYWIAWQEMFYLKVLQAQTTGELLKMPAKPALEGAVLVKENPLAKRTLNLFGGLTVGGDEPIGQAFHQLTPTKPATAINLSTIPWLVSTVPLPGKRPGQSTGKVMRTYTQYVCADPEHYLTGLEVEVKGTGLVETINRSRVELEGDLKFHLDAGTTGKVVRFHAEPTTAVRLAAIRLVLKNLKPDEVLSWQVTGRFRRCTDAGSTLVLRPPPEVRLRLDLDDIPLGKQVHLPRKIKGLLRPQVKWDPYYLVQGNTRLKNLSPGKHTIYFNLPGHQTQLHLAPGEEVDLVLLSSDNPHRVSRPWEDGLQLVSTPYAAQRMGPFLGDDAGQTAGDVRFFEDRLGSWIVLWSVRRDLYMAVSSDRGRTWSKTVPLPPPVNSAHNERIPALMQDSEGRYILSFSSDRNVAHGHAVHVCWSDDLQRFSAPVLVAAQAGVPLRLFQRPDGMYLAYLYLLDSKGPVQLGGAANPTGRWVVCSSPDLLHWSAPQTLRRGLETATLDIAEDQGRYVALSSGPRGLTMQTSNDGLRFADPWLKVDSTDSRMPIFRSQHLVCRRVAGRLLAFVRGPVTLGTANTGTVLCYRQDTKWDPIALAETMPGGAVADYWSGDFAFDNYATWYFLVPRAQDKRGPITWTGHFQGWQLTTAVNPEIAPPMGVPSESEWTALGPPLFVVRQPLDNPLASADASSLPFGNPARLHREVIRAGELPQHRKNLNDPRAEIRHKSAYALALTGRDAAAVVPVLIASLHQTDAETRRQAALALSRLGQQAHPAVAALLQALQDAHPGVRQQAHWTLLTLGIEPSKILPVLKALLQDQDVNRRRFAADALFDLGTAGLSLLTEALADEDLQVCELAVKGLREHGPRVPAAMAQLARSAKRHVQPAFRSQVLELMANLSQEDPSSLLELIRDKDAALRVMAISATGFLGSYYQRLNPTQEKVLLPALRQACEDADVNTRLEAFKILNRYGLTPPNALTQLTALLRGPDVEGRRTAARSLKEMGVPAAAAAPVLTKALGDEDKQVRMYGALALARMGIKDQAMIAPLIEFLGEPLPAPPIPRSSDHQLAVNGLMLFGPAAKAAVPALQKLLRELPEYDFFANYVRLALKRIDTAAVPSVAIPPGAPLAELEQVLKENPAYIMRLTAMRQLAKFGEAAVPQLSKSLHDAEKAVRNEAARYLGQLAPLGAQTAMPALAASAAKHTDTDTRMACARALVQFLPDGKEALLGLLRLGDAAVRQGITDGLRDLKVPPPIDFLKQLLKDKALPVRFLGARWLKQSVASETLPVLLEAVHDPVLKHQAVRILEEFGADGKPALPTLRAVFQKADDNWRLSLARAIVAIEPQDQPARALLLALVREGQMQGYDAAMALGGLGPAGRDLTPDLIGALKNKTRLVRAAAAHALSKIGPGQEVIPPILQAYREDRLSLYDLVRVLGNLGGQAKEHLGLAKAALQDSNPMVRHAAVIAIYQIDPRDQENLARLEAILRQPKIMDLSIMEFLKHLGPGERNLVPLLCQVLPAQPRSVYFPFILDGLGNLGPEAAEAIPILEKALKDPDPLISSRVSRLLQRIKGS